MKPKDPVCQIQEGQLIWKLCLAVTASVWMNRSSFLELFYCCASNVCFALPFILLCNYLKYRWPQLMLIFYLFSHLLSDPVPTEVRTPLCFSCRSWMSVHTLKYKWWLSLSAHKQLYTNSFQSSPLRTRGFLMLKSRPKWRMSSHSGALHGKSILHSFLPCIYIFKKNWTPLLKLFLVHFSLDRGSLSLLEGV